MDAKDLRIGNLVNFQIDKTVRQGWVENINAFSGKVVIFTAQSYEGNFGSFLMTQGVETFVVKLYNIKPIPLTEEWLIKFGFEKDKDDSFVKDTLAVFLDMRFKENVYFETTDTGNFASNSWHKLDNVKVKYVHQLQNLYFALTGKELKL